MTRWRCIHLPEQKKMSKNSAGRDSVSSWGRHLVLWGTEVAEGEGVALVAAVQTIPGGHADLLLVVLQLGVQLLVELGKRESVRNWCSHPVLIPICNFFPFFQVSCTYHAVVMVGAALLQRLQQLVNGRVGQPHHGGRGRQRELQNERKNPILWCAGDRNAPSPQPQPHPNTLSCWSHQRLLLQDRFSTPVSPGSTVTQTVGMTPKPQAGSAPRNGPHCV